MIRPSFVRKLVSSNPRRVSFQTWAGTLRVSWMSVSMNSSGTDMGRGATHELRHEPSVQRVLRGCGLLPHRGDRRFVTERGRAADEGQSRDTFGVGARDDLVDETATGWTDEDGASDPQHVHEPDEVGGEVLGQVAVRRPVGVAMPPLRGGITVQRTRQPLQHALEIAPGLVVGVHEHDRFGGGLARLGVGNPEPLARTAVVIETEPMIQPRSSTR